MTNMRVLHIIPSLNKGGAERMCLDICNELNSRSDIDLCLVSFHKNSYYPFLTKSINWKVIPSSVLPSVFKPWKIETQHLQEFISVFKPEIIHVHLFESVMVLSQLDIGSSKIFIHFHDNMKQFENLTFKTFRSKQKLTDFYEKRRVLKFLKNKRSHFIGISKSSIQFLKRVLPQKHLNNLHYCPNALDLDLFKKKVDENNQSDFTLITVGSLTENKAQQLSIETIDSLLKRGIDAKLIIVGDGPLMSILKGLTSRKNLKNSVEFTGLIDHPEDLLQRSDLYLHTAKSEAFGLTILEAMASGLAVICTDGGGNRDLIQNGINGFLISERDPELMADKIELIIKDQTLRQKMSKNALKIAEKYDIKSYIDRLLILYNS